ncbi:23S rRNA (uridine(2552)-2'-O)-methyltransferase RlmE [Marinobacterium sediminicola]|uniref:Ribosomal RNA large subunit methyltransferase E n=1 Tax=Marinobacterium sediminicola TaxID=518898 RepID=A0ABY1RWL1_9GAMM|nr:23S rRNA (uridine(2552)-2'-O)-methyltransferase RlmE [Marinobacterium sediminicola]ULG70364.1 23S rRNA (uridine(2552)-2'-O)-methyltransferase RlmE [Marinobacterium sediminicola]SMR69607.1 23S rRNA Um-2552 2'-O-methyltransferase [Marinobacterium sediminicola]
MARSKSSARWLNEHVNDPFVKQAQKDGYRSRASYKLLALNEKDKLIKPGMLVIDLGSAPGGWSQIASQLVGEKGKVIASDILPMDALPDVDFIQGDFTEESVFDEIMSVIDGRPVDVVISDMAPNLSGVAAADQAGSIYLIELALDMAQQVLKPKGSFVAKAFQGEGYEEFVKQVREHFDTVLIRKPEASRARSREVYVVGKGFKG